MAYLGCVNEEVRTTAAAFAGLPPVWPHAVLARNRRAAAASTLVVLDDDPTGTQTVRGVAVVTAWDPSTLRAELSGAPPGFFILTNSRSLDARGSLALHRELAGNLLAAATAVRRPIVVASRSDSTLRGHFPLETDALAGTLGPFDATFLVPYFEAGGRCTLDDVHYVREGERLVPAADTPFARDPVFGYSTSHLPSWVEEKTGGRIPAGAVASVSLDLLRRGGPWAVAVRLRALPRGSVCVVNAAAPRDVEVFAAASLAAERRGSRFLYRTAAGFVAARLGQRPGSLLPADALRVPSARGGLVVVGSHVPQTTAQLERVHASCDAARVEVSVPDVLDPRRRSAELARAGAVMNAALASGRDAVVFTSREPVMGSDATAGLEVGRSVSDALVAVVRQLAVTPRFLVAKGGITSSDVATRGLGVRRAVVLGQALPGVPVWRLGPEARFPGLAYVLFPGNVGSPSALADLVGRLGGA